MADYQSKFTGQEVDNAVEKLRSWIAADASSRPADSLGHTDISTVTIDGSLYTVLWKLAPTSSNNVYGIGLNPSGKVYQIHSDHGTYSAFALDTATLSTSSDTFLKSVTVSGGSYTETTRYLTLNYTNGTAVRGGTTKYANPSFTGSAVTSGANADNVSVASTSHTHDVQFTKSDPIANAGATDINYLQSSASTKVSASFTGTAVNTAAPTTGYTVDVPATTHIHTITPTLTANAAQNANNTYLEYVQSISSSTKKMGATFTGTSATSDGPSATAVVATDAHTHSVTATGTIGSITPSGSVTLADGATGDVAFIQAIGTHTHTPASLGTASTGLAAPGNHTHTYDTYSLSGSNSSHSTKKMSFNQGAFPTYSGTASTASANTAGENESAITAVTGYSSTVAGSFSASRGTSGTSTTARRYLTFTHSSFSLGAASTESVAPASHTHAYDKVKAAVSVAVATAGTLPSLDFDAASGTTYVSSVTNSDLTLTTNTNAGETGANNGTNFNAVTDYPNFDGGSGDITGTSAKYMSASFSGTAVTPTFTGSAVSTGGPSDTVSVGSASHTHNTTATGSVSLAGGTNGDVDYTESTTATTKWLSASASCGSSSNDTVSVPSTSHIHSVTPSGSVTLAKGSSGDITLVESTVQKSLYAETGSPLGDTSVAGPSHTHGVTAAGSVALNLQATGDSSNAVITALNALESVQGTASLSVSPSSSENAVQYVQEAQHSASSVTNTTTGTAITGITSGSSNN